MKPAEVFVKERWALQNNRNRPGLFTAFDGRCTRAVGQVLIASANEKKIARLNSILDGLNVWFGPNLLNQARPVETVGQEPDWDRADKVAQHKVDNVINVINGQFGSDALVFGSDVVVWIDGKAYTNLSREGKLYGSDLDREVDRLVSIFKTPTRVMWDVAVAASRKGGKVSLTNRYVVDFNSLPEKKIRELFWEDIPAALGRNTRIPLIDEFQDKALGAWMVPLVKVLDWKRERFLPEESWVQLMELIEVSLVKDSVLGGFPVGRLVQEFFEAPITGDNVWYPVEELKIDK